MIVLNDCFDMKEEVEDVDYGKARESLPDIKHESVDIRFEHNYSATPLQILRDEPVDCTGTNLFRNCLNGKEEIKDICDDNAIERLSSIKCENIEIKSEEDYSDSSVHMNVSEEQMFKRGHQLRHKDVPKKLLYQCDSCNFKSIYKICVIKHQTKHNHVPMYKCDSCDYKSFYKEWLKKHQVKKHVPGEDMYKCDLCDFKSIYKICLTTHQTKHETKHNHVRMYKCDSCDYKSFFKSALKQHQVKHQVPEEDMYKCDSCDFKTIYKRCLSQHQLIHNDIFKSQMYQCDLCDFKSVYASSFRHHQRRHENIREDRIE